MYINPKDGDKLDPKVKKNYLLDMVMIILVIDFGMIEIERS